MHRGLPIPTFSKMNAGNANLHLIVAAGTQVVTGIDFKDKEGRIVIPKG
jgi:hypothetical protein